MILAVGYRRLRKRREAVRVLASAARAYRGYVRWLGLGPGKEPPTLLAQYEEACRQALRDLDPPVDGGRDPVRRVLRAARRLRPRRAPKPARAITAIDTLITIGRSTAQRSFHARVGREIAAMLGARVLFHRHGRRWLRRRPQAEHTLSSWTVHRLARLRALRAFRVRPRPEFWRPEQRRPGALLVVPLGDGTLCLSRTRPFDPRETDAVRTVTRFLAARLGHGPGAPAEAAHRTTPRAPLATKLVGDGPAWREVLRQVARVAESSAPVLIVGESGTGKEGVAQAIHAASRRSAHAFVAVNCGALSPALLASELFGHVRGAFTGADRTREGLLVRAHRGTLFLDEAADMPAEMQVALLRVLEDRKVRPLGAMNEVPADVRVLSASARDLADEVRGGRFRADLLHRLEVVRLELPPLRRRMEDLPLLAAHLVARTQERATLHPDALPLLLDYDWPGNVRELDNVLRACAVLADDGEITPAVLRGILAQRKALRRAPRSAADPTRQAALVAQLGSGWLSAPEIAARLGVSVRTVNRDLVTLMASGQVVAVGDARARRYTRPG